MKSINKKLFISDQRMLELLDYALHRKLVSTKREFFEKIGYPPNNIHQITSGKQGFTDEQKLAAARLTGANMNWLFGLEPNMKRIEKIISPVQMIKEAIRILERDGAGTEKRK